MLTLGRLQDWMALSDKYTDRSARDETINDPTNPRHYWRYRMHHYLEDIIADKDFVSKVQCMHLQSGRASPSDYRDALHGLLCVQGDPGFGYQV